jgi:hypothetical protein
MAGSPRWKVYDDRGKYQASTPGSGGPPKLNPPTDPDGANADRCLYCGAQLRPERWAGGEHRGAYGDDAFCTSKCGYAFGVAFARLGGRLRPVDGPGDGGATT